MNAQVCARNTPADVFGRGEEPRLCFETAPGELHFRLKVLLSPLPWTWRFLQHHLLFRSGSVKPGERPEMLSVYLQ